MNPKPTEPEPKPELKSELDSFRQQWISEVRAKHSTSRPPYPEPSGPASGALKKPGGPAKKLIPRHLDDVHEYVSPRPFDDVETAAPLSPRRNSLLAKGKGKEPVSALDHYEAAVEKESQGSLGDSLQLYRKAFRMDSLVDKEYKDKHFPRTHKPTNSNPSSAAVTVPNTAHHSSGPGGGAVVSMTDLIASFAGHGISTAPPEVEGMDPPPCPLADLPSEILVHILQDVATTDVGDLCRVSQVCKHFAYLIATESGIWRCLCEGPEFGFGGMHYRFTRTITWDQLPPEPEFQIAPETNTAIPRAVQERAREERRVQTTQALLHSTYGGSWRRMFRSRPRIRFGGAYISTVNYIRSGQAGPNQVTWGSPVHIVTYYRYLRFFRDGTLISLLTTSSPAEVVPHLTRQAVELHSGGDALHLPSAVIREAQKGRWKLGSAWDDCADDEAMWVQKLDAADEEESNLFIETEGIGKYTYEMELALRNAGRSTGFGPQNNKLVWRAFYSYNRLTDDRGEFTLKHYKPFFFSRVRSFGIGE